MSLHSVYLFAGKPGTVGEKAQKGDKGPETTGGHLGPATPVVGATTSEMSPRIALKELIWGHITDVFAGICIVSTDRLTIKLSVCLGDQGVLRTIALCKEDMCKLFICRCCKVLQLIVCGCECLYVCRKLNHKGLSVRDGGL
jgi:hypothetical protein